MVANAREDTVTYCISCGSTIYWDGDGDPILVRSGNQNLVTCLTFGCTLLSIRAAGGLSNFELLRRKLIEAGVPDDAAMSIAAIIATHQVGAPAA